MECLHKRGYELFVERVEALIKEHGKIRILFDMDGFHGWEKGAQWFDIDRHFPGVERVAFVGDPKWENNIGALCKPFPSAQLRYFESESLALAWVASRDP
jgi:hypothetical protein